MNEETQFIYTVLPNGDVRDSGFDRLRMGASAPIDPLAVRVQVGEDEVIPKEVRTQGDTLLFIDFNFNVVRDLVAGNRTVVSTLWS